jgi:HicB family
MQLHDYVQQVSDQLRAAASLGDERTQQVAATLTGAAEASVRLAIVRALSAAGDEITAALLDADIPGSPTAAVSLDGDEVRVRISLSATDSAATQSRADEGDATARISLRLPEGLKNEVERAAAAEGVSVNTWLVRAASVALDNRRRGPSMTGGRGAYRITGWVTG